MSQLHPPTETPAGEAPPEDQGLHPEQTAGEGQESRRSFVRRHPVTVATGFAVFALVLTGGALYWDYARRFETTDDAFIAARQFAVAPQVGGYVTAVPVTDNQHVAARAVIAQIDERIFRATLAQTEAEVAAAKADIATLDARIPVQSAQIAVGQAQLDEARATLVFAREQAGRFERLARQGAGTVQDKQRFDSQFRQQQAAVRSAQANLKLAETQLRVLRAQRQSALANLMQAKARRDRAQLDLSFTTVTAAQSGYMVQLSAAVGQYAQAGTSLAMFVPDEIWVTANFKETQLEAMRPGQEVTLRIDAYPGRKVHGVVASIQPGSGTAFSLLPAENATGNFVKIVQRVPVKIIMDDPPTDVALGPGMSVIPRVRVDAAPSLLERLGVI